MTALSSRILWWRLLLLLASNESVSSNSRLTASFSIVDNYTQTKRQMKGESKREHEREREGGRERQNGGWGSSKPLRLNECGESWGAPWSRELSRFESGRSHSSLNAARQSSKVMPTALNTKEFGIVNCDRHKIDCQRRTAGDTQHQIARPFCHKVK